MAVNETKLNESMGNFVHDIGAVMHAATVVVGDQLGLYKALARRTEPDPRYLREVVEKGGFTRFRRASQTPFNLVFEARP